MRWLRLMKVHSIFSSAFVSCVSVAVITATVTSFAQESVEDDSGTSDKSPGAALPAVPALLSNMVLAATPDALNTVIEYEFDLAETVRLSGDADDAIAAYIDLIEAYPGSLQARAADSRANHLMHMMTDEELVALGQSLPDGASLTSLEAITILGQYHNLCAERLMSNKPSAAVSHLQSIYELAGRAFDTRLEDDYKITILDAYLRVAGALNKDSETRRSLSRHARTLPWSFTRWLITKEIDGDEPSPDLVPSLDGRESIRKYYLLKGRATIDTSDATLSFEKSRDLAWSLLATQPSSAPRFDLCHAYLEAAHEVGPSSAKAAVANVENYISNTELSVLRWIVRYELAMYLTRVGSSGSEARAGFEHFETMLFEATNGMVEDNITNPSLDREFRGLLACVWGHAYAGTNRVEESRLFYDWVLEYCEPETHPGASAGYALTAAFERDNTNDPDACVAAYDTFVHDHPSSFYAPDALLRIAEIERKAKNYDEALTALGRVKREYQNRSVAREIDQIIGKVSTEQEAALVESAE